jgi:hypothetical protein
MSGPFRVPEAALAERAATLAAEIARLEDRIRARRARVAELRAAAPTVLHALAATRAPGYLVYAFGLLVGGALALLLALL